MTIEELYKIFLNNPSVQTDTRKLKKGDLFFALKGPNFNANLFALTALQSGASYAIVDEKIDDKNEKIILVEDVLATLQNLAKFHREQFNIPFIAITGSNGKTTTKELIHAVLSSQFRTYTTEGNLNNHIGIPLTILKIKADAEIAVIEMGANHQKEIEGYCVYAQPTHGIITNCGKAHLEGFGGEEGVRKGKGELFDFIRKTKGSAFAFDDYNYLHEMSKGIQKIFWYGTKSGNIIGDVKTAAPFLEVNFSKGISFDLIKSQLVGSYNLPNILCAVAVGKYFNVSEEKIKTAIENYIPSNSRSQLIEKNSNKIILDAYNANPTSMKAAIENFASINSSKKNVLLGAMMELGKESIEEHQNIIYLLEKYDWENVALVGGDFTNTKHHFYFFTNVFETKEWFDAKQFQNAYFLIKGSRTMQMEKILQ